MATVIYPDNVAGATALPNPLAIQVLSGDTPVSYGGQDLRWLIGSVHNRYGRIGYGDSLWLYPRAAGADWSVDVNFGMAVVGANPSTSYTPERYLVTLPARINIPLTFTHSPTGTRNHGVWIVVSDASQTGVGAGYRAAVVVTEDTTGSGAPDPPGSFFVRIGTATIAPSQSNIGAANLSTTMQRSSRATPFTEVTYKSGFTGGQTNGTGQGLSYSVDGNTVKWQGSVCRSPSGNFTAGTVYDVATPPSSLWPKYLRLGVGVSAGPNFARIAVPSTGGLQLTPYTPNVTDMAYISLDGFSYEIF